MGFGMQSNPSYGVGGVGSASGSSGVAQPLDSATGSGHHAFGSSSYYSSNDATAAAARSPSAHHGTRSSSSAAASSSGHYFGQGAVGE